MDFGVVSPVTRTVMRANVSHGTRLELEAAGLLVPMGLELTGQSDRGVLPGSPDFVSLDAMVAVFVHGCFWHGCRHHYKLPKSNVEFWRCKVEKNVSRDRRASAALRRASWSVFVLWEHDFRPLARERLRRSRHLAMRLAALGRLLRARGTSGRTAEFAASRCASLTRPERLERCA